MYDQEPLPEALQWSEGMLLTPQHFQQGDIYWERRLRHVMAQLQPHYWGVLDLAVDRAALADGQVHIQRLECVLPDGLVVQYPGTTGDEVLALDVSKEPALAQNRPLTISLAVPVRADGAASSAAPIQRFDSVAGGVALDENTGEEQVPMTRLRPRLSLQAGDELPSRYVTLPLFKLVQDLSGEVKLDDFHPPLLRIGASAFLEEASLQQRLVKLATRIRAKARELAGYNEPDAAVGGLRGVPEQRAMVTQLGAALPAFEILANNASTHPFAAYLGLAQLVGQASAVLANPVPMQMAAYRHQDLMPGFSAALDRLEDVLTSLQLGYEMLPLEAVGEGVFEGDIPADWPADALMLELRGGGGPGEMLTWLGQAALGDAALHPLFEQRRIPGAEYSPVSPQAVRCLPLRDGSALVRLNNLSLEEAGQSRHVLSSGGRLRVAGPTRGALPQTLVLYHLKGAALPVETRPEHVV
jgi:type VI secretion system protein ImpJ